jgi:flagella basal body P-ring formation protein FlgA
MINKKIQQVCFLMLMILSLGVDVKAAELEPLDNIEQAAYSYALSESQMKFENAQVSVQPLDKRLRMQACETELNVFSKQSGLGTGKQTIGVKCNAPMPWTVYVQTHIKVMKQVVVSTKPLTANQIIQKQDVKLQLVDVSNFRRGYWQSTNQVVGQQLKYPVALGGVLNKNALKAEKVVKRGELIMLVAEAGAMQVRMSGKALSDASLGQRIKVKNQSSKRIVEGVVDAPGIVKVTM